MVHLGGNLNCLSAPGGEQTSALGFGKGREIKGLSRRLMRAVGDGGGLSAGLASTSYTITRRPELGIEGRFGQPKSGSENLHHTPLDVTASRLHIVPTLRCDASGLRPSPDGCRASAM